MSEPSTPLSRTVHSRPPTEEPVGERTVVHEDIGSTITQVGVLAQEMSKAWQGGHRLFAESYLDRYPELRDNRDAVLRLVCEEISLREAAGLALSREDLLRRFPRWSVELEALLDAHEMIESDAPITGDGGRRSPWLQDFEVLAELGEGAQGQVYLVRQKSLADRPLVIKVSTRKGSEHLTLARLQHTGIVPLYWVKDDAENDRRTLCMPYFGKVTASGILRSLRTKNMHERSGRDVLDILDNAREAMAMDQPGLGAIRAFLASKSYVEVVCWMGACLADALEYAHQRGLVHLDIKPSNILLSNDGQPMLLDFHLSCPPMIPGKLRPSRMGGTPLYMSPEQHAAMLALSNGRDIPLPVDGRSDIYSLGVILYQLLGGKVPLLSPPPRLDAISKEVSCGLADIIEKCLAPDANHRYQKAAELSEDLNRHLENQPLVGVRNRSWKERWHKYRRREPRALGFWGLLLMLVTVLAGAGLMIASQDIALRQDRRDRIANLLADSERHLQAKKPGEAVALVEKALALAREQKDPASHAAAAALLQKAKRGELLTSLHELSEQIRFAATETTSERQVSVEKACRELWDARDKIFGLLAKDASKQEIEQAKMDLLDLAVLSAHLRMALAAPVVKQQAGREALIALLEAEKALGASPVLSREMERIAKVTGASVEPALSGPPASPWDHYALGRSYFLEGNLEQALKCFEASLKIDPGAFWPNFADGLTAFRLNRYPEALAAFRTAIAIRPCAPAYYNRGLVYARLNDLERAERDYIQALRLDDKFGPAFFAQGLVLLAKKAYPDAIHFFQQARQNDHEPGLCHYHEALGWLGRNDRVRAMHSLQVAIELSPHLDEAKKQFAKLKAEK